MIIYFIIPILSLVVTLITMYKSKNWKIQEVTLFQLFAPVIVGCVVVSISMASKFSDYEYWNGEVVNKTRKHDYWLESYDCNCVTDDKGNETCQTCYTDHYTVDWDINCNVGVIHVADLDEEDESVYKTPDPEIYAKAIKGEACSVKNIYENYLKASTDSILSNEKTEMYASYNVPSYPGLYSMYKINRAMGFGKYDMEMSLKLSDGLRKIGPSKQANIIILGTTEYDRQYRYAVENRWKGGKKNDVIVLVGYDKTTNKIYWADVITLGENSGNELMSVKLRDSVLALDKIGPSIVDVSLEKVTKHFDRKPMADYEYIKEEIGVDWKIALLALLITIICNLSIYFYCERSYYGTVKRSRYGSY